MALWLANTLYELVRVRLGTTISDFAEVFEDANRARQYAETGPPAFTPGHAGLMQMIGVLLAEATPSDGTVLVIGAGGGLEIRYLAGIEPAWRFIGVDPAAPMLALARVTAGEVAGDRMTLVEGTVADAPQGSYDAATCILVLGLVPDNGSKLDLLRQAHRRLSPGAPFILVDHCIDRSASDFDKRLDRYAAYARRSGMDEQTVAKARSSVSILGSMVSAQRNEQLLTEAGFSHTELFYLGMAWRGWIAYA